MVLSSYESPSPYVAPVLQMKKLYDYVYEYFVNDTFNLNSNYSKIAQTINEEDLNNVYQLSNNLYTKSYYASINFSNMDVVTDAYSAQSNALSLELNLCANG